MNAETRPPKGAGPKAPTPDSTVDPAPDTPRASAIYLVSGTRQTARGPESCTQIRRNLPAAHRAAAQIDAKGHGPATIHGVFVRRWQHVPRAVDQRW